MEIDRNWKILDGFVIPAFSVEGFDAGERGAADEAAGDKPKILLILVVGIVSSCQGHGLGVGAALQGAAVSDPFAATLRGVGQVIIL